jgi:thiamine pyrophosphokinase
MDNCAAIVLGGDENNTKYFRDEILKADKIIACDRGADYLYALEIKPDVLIGDMDSINKNVYNYFVKKNVSLKVYNSIKDQTDDFIAFRCAFQDYNCSVLNVYAFEGGRMDHFISILMNAERSISKGERINFRGKNYTIYSFMNNMELNTKRGEIISIFTFSEAITGNCDGLFYNISNRKFKQCESIGISNKAIENKVYISIQKGKLTLFHYKK